jgi:hypothetical protein
MGVCPARLHYGLEVVEASEAGGLFLFLREFWMGMRCDAMRCERRAEVGICVQGIGLELELGLGS